MTSVVRLMIPDRPLRSNHGASHRKQRRQSVDRQPGCAMLLARVNPMPDAIGQFAQAKYLNLETFRKTGVGVRTPVWFAADPGSRSLTTFYVYTLPDSGKVKRIRNNAKVRIAPCTMRGDLRGAWVDARARLCTGDEAAKG